MMKFTFLLATGLVVIFSSCHSYYKSTSLLKQDVPDVGQKLDSFATPKRYLVLRNGTAGAYRISSIQVSNDKTTATLSLDSVGSEHKHHLSGSGTNRRYRAVKASQKEVVNEVHVYVPYDADAKKGSYTLPLDKVEKIEVLQKDRDRTVKSHIFGAVKFGLAGLCAFVIGLALFWHPHF